MRLSKLAMKNFGPYRDEAIDLSTSSSANVVVIHGENMRGKTSLKNALLWCLYEETADRRGRPLSTYDHLNLDALGAGEYFMTVTLDFEHDGKSMRLQRHAQAAAKPASDADLEVKVNLSVDGRFIPTEDIPEAIANILHPQIARFFIFDADMLQQYETLLGDPDRETEFVKNSIERILGLPALQLVAEDLQQENRDAQQRQLRAVQAKHKNEALVVEAQQANAEIEAIDIDLGGLESLVSDLEEEKAGLWEQLQQFAQIQSDLKKLASNEEEIQRLKAEQEEQKNTCRDLLSEVWWMPVVGSLDSKIGALRTTIKDASSTLETDRRLSLEIGSIEKSLDETLCSLCGQPVHSEVQTQMSERLSALKDERGALSLYEGDLGALVGELEALEAFADQSAPVLLREAERRVRQINIDIRRLDRESDQIRGLLKGHEHSQIQQTERRLEEAVNKLNDLKDDIDDKRAKRVTLQRELSELQQKIAGLPDADPRTATEAAIYAALEELFRQAIASYRDEMRRQVESEATSVFKELTTEPEYEGLRINQQFGLRIVDTSGREIGQRSAGAEQIVALSLVGGLNRCATREGPLVIDTPLARLDLSHRENILKFLPTLSPQVVFLFQSGEIPPEDGLNPLEGRIARKYQIVRDSQTQSHLEKMDGS